MTVFEAGGHLYEWLSKNDSYNQNKDYNKLILVSDTPEADRAAISLALDNFKELNIAKDKEVEGDTYWVLNKKYESNIQNVEISATSARRVYNLVKLYIDTAGLEDKYECDPLNIQQKDIEILMDSIIILGNK